VEKEKIDLLEGRIKPSAPLSTFSLASVTFEEAERFAKIMADSEMVPTAYRNKPGNVLVAVQMGAELGIKPLQAIQNIAVINGKPSIYGDLGVAILRSHGCQIDSDDIDVVKKNKRARCKITRTSGETVERTFGEDDARAAGLWGKQGPWTTYPWRQMAWRAFWFAARDGAADLLKGMHGAEEMQDIIEVERVDTVLDDGPKRASETRAAPPPAAPVSAIAPATPPAQTASAPIVTPPLPPASPPSADAEQCITVAIKEVKFEKLKEGGFDFFVHDSEGVIYHTRNKEIAKAIKAHGDAQSMATLWWKAVVFNEGGQDWTRNELTRAK